VGNLGAAVESRGWGWMGRYTVFFVSQHVLVDADYSRQELATCLHLGSYRARPCCSYACRLLLLLTSELPALKIGTAGVLTCCLHNPICHCWHAHSCCCCRCCSHRCCCNC
jgi:hypothetical protein